MKTADEIFVLSRGISQFAPKTIHTSYKVFIDHFQRSLSDQLILSGAYMVYGWMPTMLRLKGSVDSVYKAAYAAREGRLNPEIIDACSATLNNSLVGTTKLIHFIAPTLYPIWDSRVYRALYGKRPHPYRVEDSITYMRYLDWVCDFEEQSQFLDLRLRFEEEAGYSVSSKRVADAVLYALGPKPSKG